MSKEEVELSVAGRDEVRTIWTENISKGGLYVATLDPPKLRAHVTVHLRSPDGALALRAEVVQIFNATQAEPLGMEPGVGLQFVDLEDDDVASIALYVEGLADRLRNESNETDESSAAESNAVVQRLLRGVERNELYDAIGVEVTDSADAVAEKIDDLHAMLQRPPRKLTPGERRRFAQASRLLERIACVLSDSARRLDYDIRVGNVRMDELLAERPRGEVAKLRQSWKEAFPDRFEEAKALATRASALAEQGKLRAALRIAREALRLDPLNLMLLEVVSKWRKQSAGLLANGPSPVSGTGSRAAS